MGYFLTFLFFSHRFDVSERKNETHLDDTMFAPAEHSDSIKRRKERKRQAQRLRQQQGTPPRQPTLESETVGNEEDVWYAKWWMLCFPDLKNMLPKR